MPILTRYDPIQCNSNSLSWSDSTFFPHKKTKHNPLPRHNTIRPSFAM